MGRLLLRTIYRVLAGVLGAVFAASGCSEEGGYAEYGSPSAEYHISGRVTDADTGQPVPGIEVRFFVARPDTTDAEGRWSFDGRHPYCMNDCALEVTDIDGDTNGRYLTHVEPLDLVQTGDGEGWYRGRFEQSNVQVELQPEAAPKPRE